MILKVLQKASEVLAAGLLVYLSLCASVYAFHNGGVGQCDGCHVMHSSSASASEWLLPGPDPSSVCLNCHAGASSSGSSLIATDDGSAMTPGGDFYWLKKNFSWPEGSSPGETHGHNIVAFDYGYLSDPSSISAPGGTYLSTDLGCNSCHDPHGTVSGGLPVSASGSYGGAPKPGTLLGKYRLLGGTSYDGGKQAIGYTFLYDTPAARQSSVNRYSESDASHVDYGSGMSEWCANCHYDFLFNKHQAGAGNFEHPAGNNALLGDYVDSYNQYVATGDLSGTAATAYLALVPFERGVADPNLLDPSSTQGPDNGSNIMCLTCHRAHASAFPYAGRWDFNAELIIDSHPADGDAGVTGNDVLYSYYGRNMQIEFGVDQRSLCEKCHEVPRDGYPPGW